MRLALSVALACVLSLAVTGSAGATVLPSGFSEVTMVSGFGSPVDMAHAPDGRTFVVEKSGRLRVVLANGTLRSTPVLDLRTKVNAFSDRGMLGVEVDKDFATNGYVYLLYVYELNPLNPDQDGPMTSRLTRVKVNPDNTLAPSGTPESPETVILGKAYGQPCPLSDNNVDCIPADYKWHAIGTVKSDPVDGTLWVGNGDTHAPSVDAARWRPYDENNLAGKIMHIDRDGRGLPNHPFCQSDNNLDHVCTKIYAKGFRNPFRFSLRPGKGPVVGDVGETREDEIDLIKPGKNYGWPCYEGSVRHPVYGAEAQCQAMYAKEGTAEAATPPSWSYSNAGGAAVVGGPEYSGSNYPADMRGDVFVADYAQGWVKRLEVDSADNVTAVHDFATEWGSGVDIELLPGSGDLAYLDLGWGGSPGEGIKRFTYAGGNGIPVPRATATPTSGPAPLTVQFDGRGSTDPDGDALTYEWDFGDGSPRSTSPNPQHTYASGTYTAKLTVDDGLGRNPSTTVSIQAGNNAAPSAAITAPVDESKYRNGEPVTLAATGSDAEDGTLPDSAFQWQIRLHHNTHIHEFATPTGRSASFTPATDHDADSYYEVRLTVTDSGGATTTRTADIRPETVQLTLASSPTGAPVSYDGQTPVAAPLTKTAAIGYKPAISAADTFTSDNLLRVFQTWSDGGARTHHITVPPTNTTLTATYSSGAVATDTLRFTPEADTWVDASAPTTSNGTSSRLTVDNSPVSHTYIRFPVSGLQGRRIVGAKLRMYQVDSSRIGGRVFGISSNTWTESTTWNTKPAIDGTQAAAFGAVSAGNWYTVDLGSSFVSGDGKRSIAIDSTSTDGARWGSRQSSTPPELLVEVERDTSTPPAEGLSTVAPAPVGSSEPTYFSGNHRIVTTAGGRTLALHGRNGSGVQLAWRDPGGSWQNASTGAVADGQLSSRTGTGNWPASIATARDASGAEHAWVVWSASSYSTPKAVYMLRLSDLDSPSGPRVGATSTVDAPVLGAYKADIGFERAPDGSSRGAIVWTRRATDTTWEIATAWFTDLGADIPALSNRATIYTSTSSSRFGSLVPTAAGMRIIARGSGSVLRVFKHDTAAALNSWQSSSGGAAVGTGASPNAVALGSGGVLAASDGSTTGTVVVQRFTAANAPVAPELQLTGYKNPALAADGDSAILVMVRNSDGFVVSRERSASGTWSTTDRVEIGASGGGNHAWPNTVRTLDGTLRFIVRGPTGGTTGTTVLAYQRQLGATASTTSTSGALLSAGLTSTQLTTRAKPVLRYTLAQPGKVSVGLERRTGRRWRRVRGRPMRARGRRGRNAAKLAPWLVRQRLARGEYRLIVNAAGDSLRLPLRVR